MESKLDDGEEKSGGVEDAGWRRERKIVEDEDSGKSNDGDGNSSEDEQKIRREGGNALDNEGSDAEVEAEYLAALRKANVGKVAVSTEPKAKSIIAGFRINWMDMRDAETARLLWESGEWYTGEFEYNREKSPDHYRGKEMYRQELKATVPREILDCAAVSREINFSSQEEIRHFRLEQRIFLKGACIEEWFFNFGFVIPGSTNSWQQTIESAGEDRMLAADDLSGKMTIETTFLDGKTMLFKTLVRIFYD